MANKPPKTMRITTIGFGYTKSLGNYENCKVHIEAQLEPGEDPEEAMIELRNKVAQELDLPDQRHGLKQKFARQMTALEKVNEKLQKAEKRWERYAAFLVAHGVNPDHITINSHPDSIAEANRTEPYVALLGIMPDDFEYDDCPDESGLYEYYPESDQVDENIPFAMPEF